MSDFNTRLPITSSSQSYSHLVTQFMNPKMTHVNKLSLAHFALVWSLLEMGSLVSPQTLNPGKTLPTHVTSVRFFSRVDVLMSSEVAWNICFVTSLYLVF